MNTAGDPQESGPSGLQFDRAEGDDPAQATVVSCGSCGSQLLSSYFQINGNIVCEACRYKVEEAFNAGSGLGRFLKATALGLVAGAIGAGIYFAISALTGYEIGLVAIVVGLLVGGAVRIGANRRGGWPYQVLAMFLTYSAIVSTYIPPIYKSLREEAQKQAEAESTAPREHAGADADSASGAAESVKKLPRPLLYAIRFAILFAIAFVAPFLAGIQNIIGLVIIAIGLYEAWKMNKRAVLEISGPHRLGSTPPPGGGATADAGA